MMGSWKGRGNQYIQFIRVLYCKLPTNGKQLPAIKQTYYFILLDPFHHRQMRTTMTQKEMRGHLAVKSVHIYALGNAAQISSYDYLVSYLNTTESHMQLRFSAVEAIARFEHPEVNITITKGLRVSQF